MVKEETGNLDTDAHKASQGKQFKKMDSFYDGKKYQKVLLEHPDKSENENKYHCFIHYLISRDKRTLYIQTFVCNGESGEGSNLLLNLLIHLIETEELNSRAKIELTADADAASFYVTKKILIDQKKLEEFYKKISLKQINKDTPEFSAYIGKVTEALIKLNEKKQRRESKKRRELQSSMQESSMQESSMQDQSELKSSEGGKRTRKFRKIKKRKYRKSTGKLIQFSSR